MTILGQVVSKFRGYFLIWKVLSLFESGETFKTLNKLKFNMSDLDYKLWCKTPKNVCNKSVHHIDMPFQFTHQVLILGASLVQKFSTLCDKRYGVVHRTLWGGKSCVQRQFLTHFYTKILLKLNQNLTKLLGHCSQLWYNQITMTCYMQVEFSREIRILLKGQKVLPLLNLLVGNSICER